MSLTEIHIVVDDGTHLTGLVKQLLYFVTQLGCNGVERTEHDDVITRHFRHFHIQTKIGIILIENILRIVLLVQESQRNRRPTVRINHNIVGSHSVLLHKVKDNVSYLIPSYFTDKSHIGTCTAQ